MNVMCVARDVKVGPALQRRVEALSAGLERFFRDVRKVSWSLRSDADEFRASCSLGARSGQYRAQASDTTADGAVGLVFDRLVTQRRRVKHKRIDGRRRQGARDTDSAWRR